MGEGTPPVLMRGELGEDLTMVGVMVRSNSPSQPLSRQSCLLSRNRLRLELLPLLLVSKSLPGLLTSILRSVGVAGASADCARPRDVRGGRGTARLDCRLIVVTFKVESSTLVREMLPCLVSPLDPESWSYLKKNIW